MGTPTLEPEVVLVHLFDLPDLISVYDEIPAGAPMQPKCNLCGEWVGRAKLREHADANHPGWYESFSEELRKARDAGGSL